MGLNSVPSRDEILDEWQTHLTICPPKPDSLDPRLQARDGTTRKEYEQAYDEFIHRFENVRNKTLYLSTDMLLHQTELAKMEKAYYKLRKELKWSFQPFEATEPLNYSKCEERRITDTKAERDQFIAKFNGDAQRSSQLKHDIEILRLRLRECSGLEVYEIASDVRRSGEYLQSLAKELALTPSCSSSSGGAPANS